jgi:hypothetical protein
MATLPRLTILPFLQAWDAATTEMTVRALLMPVTDPRRPLTEGWIGAAPGPAFIGANIVLKAAFPGDPSEVPTLADVPSAGPDLPLPFLPAQTQIANDLASHFAISLPSEAPVRTAEFRLGKYLPQSYRGAFAFVAPKTGLAFTDDTYHCELRCPQKGPPRLPRPPGISWAEAFACLLRLLPAARAMGLVYELKIHVSTAFADGGWLFFRLAPASDFAAQAAADPQFICTYATRVPKLSAASLRSVFTPVLFPVGKDAAASAGFGPLDEVFGEASLYNDGFAKIVHAWQPPTIDPIEEKTTGQPPMRDVGICLGWDDEDLLVAQNRMTGLNPDGSLPPEAPSGVGGYRVDVRLRGGTTWHSLCRVEGEDLELGPVALGDFIGEREIEVHPRCVKERFFLPIFFARWRGMSLVASTEENRLLDGVPGGAKELLAPVAEDAMPLRYGQHYEFRVRLADLTGGGPDWLDKSFNPGEAEVASWHFRRFVPPGILDIKDETPAGTSAWTRFSVGRPTLTFPQAVFTDAANARARLLAMAQANIAGTSTELPAIPDPDVAYLEIRVRVRAPAFDPQADEEGYRDLYNTFRSFDYNPADPAARAMLEVRWRDLARLSDFTWEVPARTPGTVFGPIDAPTARDVLIEVRAIGRLDLNYFGSDAVRFGPWIGVSRGAVRVPATAEPALFRPAIPQEILASVFLQPDPPAAAPTQVAVLQHMASPVLSARLAAAVRLLEDDGTILGEPGQRMIFGCSPGLKHHLPPDRSSLALTAPDEVPRRWINVVRLAVARDWTWLGLADPAFRVRRTIRLIGTTVPAEVSDLGVVGVAHTVNRQATRGAVDRERMEFVFIDAFAPRVVGDRPYELEVFYEVIAELANGTSQKVEVTTRLPVTTPPTQVPRVVSVGHAFGEYVAAGDYSSTRPRTRMLWMEFAEPVKDERDTYFVRFLASTPDPMLLPATTPAPDPIGYEQSELDPELVRVIRPGQSDDFAGLYSRQPLIPAQDSARHFLVPLPPNLSTQANDLFGFFTCELTVGHARAAAGETFWSTAQGRYSPSVVLEGVQHPAPPIVCDARRIGDQLVASAEFAEPILNGRRLAPSPPNTDVWLVLYCQVHQADGSSRRNIQLDLRQAVQPPRDVNIFGGPILATGVLRSPVGYAAWTKEELKDLLARYGLPEDMPLSVLAVETLPEPNGWFDDPLGGDLGQVRILRTSSLTAIEGGCCVS